MTYSQDSIPNKNFRVGLVLSGGGAKGLAHIGVLKVIEESGVKIDYISGSSMGAIVGALYASGYTVDELTEMFKDLDFDRLIRDDFKRKNKTFFGKRDADKNAVILPFNNFKVAFPSSISKGQNIYNLFVKLLDHVKDVDDFSELPIPFLCIGTDIETGDQVVLDKGYLPDAIAASAAIPTLFEPVYVNDKVLIDGGVSNNYPINELLDKNINIIIGVDVQDNLKKLEEISSGADVMLQVSNYHSQSQMTDKIKNTTVYIKPDIRDYNFVSFNQRKAIYKSGISAASLKKQKLEDIAKKQSVFHQNDSKVVKKNISNNFQLKNIDVKGLNKYTKNYILGKLKIKTPSLISRKKIENGIDGLASTGNFNTIKYKIANDSILEVDVNESNNKTSLKFSLHYDDLYKGAALINFSHKQLITNNDILSFDIILGQNIRYNFEYYIDKGFYWSIGLKSRLNLFDKDSCLGIFENSDPELFNTGDVGVIDLTNQFYLETPFVKNFALSLGLEHKRLKITNEDLSTKIEDDNFFSAFGQLKYDNLDDIYFPKNGFYFSGDYHQYFFNGKKSVDFEQFSIAKAKFGGAFKIYPKLFLNLFTEGGFRIGNNTTSTFDFVIGGYGNNLINNYTSFYGYDFMSVAGDGYVKGIFDLHYQFYRKHFATISANFSNINDGLFKDTNWLSLPDYTGYGIGYGVKTLLGPVQVKSTWSPEVKKIQWFVSVGYWF